MSLPLPSPGWYPDPNGAPQQRYFDGTAWTANVAPLAQPPAPMPAGVVTTGPNHILHLILTVLTFWACGGWIWVWLIVALANSKQTYTVDAYGRRLAPPPAPRAGNPPSVVDRARQLVNNGSDNEWITWAAIAAVALVIGIGIFVAIGVVASR